MLIYLLRLVASSQYDSQGTTKMNMLNISWYGPYARQFAIVFRGPAASLMQHARIPESEADSRSWRLRILATFNYRSLPPQVSILFPFIRWLLLPLTAMRPSGVKELF